MLEQLKQQVLAANLKLPEHDLVKFAWGNVSGIDREKGLIIIKPSGMAYDALAPGDMAVVDMDGKQIGGDLKPSTDTPIHLALYKMFPKIGGIAHTHSRWATIFAQIGIGIPALGTTHANYFYDSIPCTRKPEISEIRGAYEKETGAAIAERFKDISQDDMPAVLVHSHGPFAWGKDPEDAVKHAAMLEEIAFMAWHTLSLMRSLRTDIEPLHQELIKRHYAEKRGTDE